MQMQFSLKRGNTLNLTELFHKSLQNWFYSTPVSLIFTSDWGSEWCFPTTDFKPFPPKLKVGLLYWLNEQMSLNLEIWWSFTVKETESDTKWNDYYSIINNNLNGGFAQENPTNTPSSTIISTNNCIPKGTGGINNRTWDGQVEN